MSRKQDRDEKKTQMEAILFPQGPPTEIVDNVLNLSQRHLSSNKKSLHSRGLHCCPNRHFSLFDTILDVSTFAQSITLYETLF